MSLFILRGNVFVIKSVSIGKLKSVSLRFSTDKYN